MTIKEFIEALSLAKDIDLAEITFYIQGDTEEKCYELHSISQFGISADVNIELKEFVPPLMKKLMVRRDKQDMVNAKMKEINHQSKTPTK